MFKVDSIMDVNNLKGNEFSDSNGNTLRQFECIKMDVLVDLINAYRSDFAFVIKYKDKMFSLYKENADSVYLRIKDVKEYDKVTKPVKTDYDIHLSIKEVISYVREKYI